MKNKSITAKKSGVIAVILLYTLTYMALMGLILMFFDTQEKSLVYMGDGWRQHLRALTYYGKYLRGALRHLIADRSLTPQNFAIDIGYGSDVLTTLQYYCLGDPLAALSVFVPTSKSMAFYEALIILRPWLAGLAFCAYSFCRGEKRAAPVLTGAVVYSFSGTVMYVGFLHPYFVNPMIYYPLMLCGIEIALKAPKDRGSEKPFRRYVPFALFTALAALSNFYFFYMLAILTASYGIARLLQFHGTAGARGSAFFTRVMKDGGMLLASAFTGTLAAGVILVPVINQFIHDPRAGVKFSRSLFYSADYYSQLPKNLVTWINHPQFDTELCFTFAFIPLLVFFLIKRGHRTLKICLAAAVLLILFPAGGIMLNGFSYMTNRWTWAMGMLAGWICVRSAGDISDLISDRTASSKIMSTALSLIIPAAVIACAAWNIVTAMSPDRGAFPNEFREKMDSEAFLAAATGDETAAVAWWSEADDHDLYRYSGRNLNWNASMATGLSSTQFEFSFANGAVSDYFQMIGLNDEQNFAYLALDDRMPALSVAGVRYYTLAYDNYYEYRFVPYGFTDCGMAEGYHMYENPAALPLGFPMNRFIRRSEWAKLSLSEREEVLTCAAVLEDEDADSLVSSGGLALQELSAQDAVMYTFDSEIPFEVNCGDGVSYEEGRFTVNGEDRTAELTFDGMDGCETLLELSGLYTTGDDGLYNISFEIFTDDDEEPFLQKNLPYKTPSIQYYSNWHDFLISFGSAGDPKKKIKITFPADDTYTFDRLAVICRPLSGIYDRLTDLGSHRPANLDLRENPISHASNEFTCEAAVFEDSLLIFSMPFTEGFRAYIDGKRTAVLKTDAMFFAVPAEAGTHDIRITYTTPGLGAGVICTFIGILLFTAALICQKNITKTKEYAENENT